MLDQNSSHCFVLIHGAWHGGFAWDGVVSRLRAAGHQVDAPTLPGMEPGTSRKDGYFAAAVEAVVGAVRRQDKQVTLVGHSSAGMLLQAAAPQVVSRLRQVVFSNAFVVADGQSQLDNIPAEAATNLSALARTTSNNTLPVAAIADFVRGALMEGESVEQQDALLRQLIAQPFELLSGKVDTKPFDALQLDRAVLFCTRDHSADYLGMAARLRAYRVLTVDGSHEMLVTNPSGYCRALLELSA